MMSSISPLLSVKLYCTDIIPKKFFAVSEGKYLLRFTGIFITMGRFLLWRGISMLSAFIYSAVRNTVREVSYL